MRQKANSARRGCFFSSAVKGRVCSRFAALLALNCFVFVLFVQQTQESTCFCVTGWENGITRVPACFPSMDSLYAFL